MGHSCRTILKSGVHKLIHNECPQIGCICHLADLTIKAGMKTLPVDIALSYHSSTRKEQFAENWCSPFSSEPSTILKHCTTRWLSLICCVDRSYFLSCDEAKTAKVKKSIDCLQSLLLLSPFFSFSHTYFHPWIGLTDFFKSPHRILLVNCIKT